MAWRCSGHTLYHILLYLTWESNLSVQTDEGNIVFKPWFPVVFMYNDFLWEEVLMGIGTDVIFAVRVCVCVVFTKSNHASASKTSLCFRNCIAVVVGKVSSTTWKLDRRVRCVHHIMNNCSLARLKNNTSDIFSYYYLTASTKSALTDKINFMRKCWLYISYLSDWGLGYLNFENH